MDLALFFERYVQFVIQRVAFTKGARFSTNPKYPVNGRRPAWALKYIEPDMIIDKGNVQYIIDAKYKAHMMDLSKDSEYLKEKFREDLHQVLAYSSFGGNDNKNVMLVYPSSTEVIKRELTISSSINSYSCSVYLVGIPLRKSTHEETIKRLSEIITL
jgi:5-methylcytosine-specific restriction endonuclease McrBC regulatory subunit McrC